MSLKQLWAPWRMAFIAGEKKTKDNGCVFCELLAQRNDRENLILHRTEQVFVILNKYPYNNGHLMVVPNTHTASLTQLPESTLSALMLMGKIGVQALEATYQPEGFNLGMNLGVSGGAGIKDHLHLHVVPRWLGDTNYMPVLSETKAMPQHLETSYDDLHAFFRRL